ncbi:putative F-box protein [Tanacetum coccineum]
MDEERWITMLHRGPIKFEDLKGFSPFTLVHSELEARLESCYTTGSDICGESLDCQIMADFLCEELIDEILGKLPPKSLLRFRTLSKSWLHPEDEYMWKESAKFPVSNCHIVGSCNGIICLYKNIGSSFTLWNPSIRRKLTIPSHPSGDFTLAYGFGFDPLADDYKIVSILFEGVQTSFLYSMKANVWSNIGPPSTSFYTVKSFACFVNGILHWVVKSESSDTGHSYILTFDLSTHVFGMISLPKPNWITNEIKRLSSCDFE